MHYEELGKARFRVEHDATQEWVRIPARRNWFVLLFLGFWLTFWTMGGVMAFWALTTQGDWFLAIWLVGWAWGWLFAAATIAWQLGGAEKLSVAGGDLHHLVRMPGYRKLRIYRGGEIGALRSVPSPWGGVLARGAVYPPLFNWGGGSIQFRYGARTVHLAQGLDEAEAAMVVDRLKPKLPRAAGE